MLGHHRNGDLAAIQQGEGGVPGRIPAELAGPVRLEVDRIAQHQTGQRIDRTQRDDIVDPICGLLADPLVNDPARPFRVRAKIQQVHGRAIVLGQQVQVATQEGKPVLPPEGVGDAELEAFVCGDALGLALPFELQRQLVEGRVELVLRQAEMHDLGHLRGGIPAGTGIGHGQGKGDAVGRKDQVAWFGADLMEEIEGEGIAAAHQRIQVRCIFLLRGNARFV